MHLASVYHYMKTSDFDFDLPNELIAGFPLEQRSSSRLLCLNKQTGDISHKHFRDVLSFLDAGDLIVFNNTKVIPARLYGEKLSGGKLEARSEEHTSELQSRPHL